MQFEAPSLELLPEGHIAQIVPELKVPLWQMSQAEVPATVIALPLSHLVHVFVPVAELEYFPAGHMAQVDASAEYEPGAQVTQAVAPNPAATIPVLQSVHASVPFRDAENLPVGHKVQELTVE